MRKVSRKDSGRRHLVLSVLVSGGALGIASLVIGQAAGGSRATTEEWTMTSLGTLGGRSSTPRDINNRGQVVGTSKTVAGDSAVFLWKSGRMTDIGRYRVGGVAPPVLLNERGDIAWWGHFWRNGATMPVPLVEAMALGDGGQIVGAQLAKNDYYEAALWQGGRVRRLGGLPGDDWSLAHAISTQGVVVGRSTVAGANVQRVFAWQAGKVRRVPTAGYAGCVELAINNPRDIAGICSRTGATRESTVVWRGTRRRDLGDAGRRPPDRFVALPPAMALNERGHVALDIAVEGGRNHPAVWRGGELLDLGTLGGRHAWIADINELGHVVGTSLAADGKRYAFIWKDGVMTSLLPYDPASPPSVAVALNDRDQVVGMTVSGNVARAVLWSPS